MCCVSFHVFRNTYSVTLFSDIGRSHIQYVWENANKGGLLPLTNERPYDSSVFKPPGYISTVLQV